jgi:hypothetical protein
MMMNNLKPFFEKKERNPRGASCRIQKVNGIKGPRE